jgi:hypothetical protein
MPWRRITRRPERHRSRAAEEAHLLLIEPTRTPNSGEAATAEPRRVV